MHTVDTLQLGRVSITRVRELSGSFRTVREFFPDGPPAIWRDHADLLAPDFWDPGSDEYLYRIQSWIVRSGGRTIVVDTGVGNDRTRPHFPPFDHLRTDFLDTLRRAGVLPGDVDLVINTHLHVDHVGWNTRLQGAEWVPTFPNARYLVPRLDYEYFGVDRPGRLDSALVFGDSIAPIHRRGLDVLWEGSHRIDADLVLEAAPGHTPGSAVLWVASGSERAVFVGDLLHSPVQILEPGLVSCFCEDPETARATRQRILGRAADTRALVIPAHFGGHGAAEVRRDGAQFAVQRWAPFSKA